MSIILNYLKYSRELSIQTKCIKKYWRRYLIQFSGKKSNLAIMKIRLNTILPWNKESRLTGPFCELCRFVHHKLGWHQWMIFHLSNVWKTRPCSSGNHSNGGKTVVDLLVPFCMFFFNLVPKTCNKQRKSVRIFYIFILIWENNLQQSMI